MKKIINNILIVMFWIFVMIWSTVAITVQVPTPSGQDDIIITWSPEVKSNESTIFDIIQIVNDYLWFSVALVAMVVLVVGWIKLMSSGGNKDAMSSANKMIIWAIIAIFVAIISYALVKLIVNLF